MPGPGACREHDAHSGCFDETGLRRTLHFRSASAVAVGSTPSGVIDRRGKRRQGLQR